MQYSENNGSAAFYIFQSSHSPDQTIHEEGTEKNYIIIKQNYPKLRIILGWGNEKIQK